jgi:hypothetical protein
MSGKPTCTLMSVSNQGFIVCNLFQFCVFFITVEMSTWALAHPLSYSMGTGVQGHFVRARWPEHFTDLSFPSNAQFKNKWSYTPLPLYAFMV